MSTEPTPQASPQYSPDGRWQWDGAAWQPVRSRRRLPLWLPPVIGLAGLALLIGIAAVGSFVEHRIALGRCLSVSDTTAAVIEQGSGLDGFTLSDVRAVRSGDHSRVYFVSAHIAVPGYPLSIGTWATNDLDIGTDGAGAMSAVDLSARTSTDWGQIRDVSMSDDGAQLSRECVAER